MGINAIGQVDEGGCKVMIDIACGKNKKDGFTGVDIWEGADIVADLEIFPWPFDDNSVDEIFCSHYIEHTPDLVAFANELYRILKVGGKAEIIAPYYSSIRAWQDPTHLRAISENTYLYFNKAWRIINKLDHYPIIADFDFESIYVIDPAWKNKSEEELDFAIKHYINVVSDIRTILTKRSTYRADIEKEMRQAEKLWESGDFESATKLCHSIISSGEGGSEAYLMLAEYAYKNGDTENAEEYFHQVLVQDTDDIQAHVGLFRTFLKAGRVLDAEAYLENIKKQNPDLAGMIESLVCIDDE